MVAWGQEKKKEKYISGAYWRVCHQNGMSRGFSTVYSSTTNDFRYTHRSTDYWPITRSTAGRGGHVSLCWGPLCPASCLVLFEVKHVVCSMVSRQQHTRTSARTTYYTYRKCNIFFSINMNIKQLVYIGQSDACTTKLANGTRTAL